VALSDYIIRKRTIDDINVMRDESLRRPENLIAWKAVIEDMLREARQKKRMMQAQKPVQHYLDWMKGFGLYLDALTARQEEAKNLIKKHRMHEAAKDKGKECSRLYFAIKDSLELLNNGLVDDARARLIRGLEEAEEMSKANQKTVKEG
jgi:hypothetical protein